MLWIGLGTMTAGAATVRGRLEVMGKSKSRRTHTPVAVVWLTPVPGGVSGPIPAAPSPPAHLQLVQRNKSFEPHVLVVPAGSSVEFPNHDPFFHNVFSLFEGKRFDLGLYEAGTSRTVRFDRPGISYIFCNIHPDMSAVVIALDTPWYAVSTGNGPLSIPDVPFGRYWMRVWSEGMAPESNEAAKREITISEGSTSLGVIRVPEPSGQSPAHKNKYGRDYETPSPDNSVYQPQRQN